MPDHTCSINNEDCSAPGGRIKKGLCGTHYQRLSTHGDARLKVRKMTIRAYPADAVCAVNDEECTRSSKQKLQLGLCRKHHYRLKANGDPLEVVLRQHGMSRTPTYKSWKAVIQRCLNPNQVGYADYGGRGIRVADRWRNSFENFLADMGERPEGTSIDRIDVNGDYEPGNCRWADASTQSRNQRKRPGTSSQYRGVRRRGSKWHAAIAVNGTDTHLGSFKNEDDAARARDAKVMELGLDAPLNFPEVAVS